MDQAQKPNAPQEMQKKKKKKYKSCLDENSGFSKANLA